LRDYRRTGRGTFGVIPALTGGPARRKERHRMDTAPGKYFPPLQLALFTKPGLASRQKPHLENCASFRNTMPQGTGWGGGGKKNRVLHRLLPMVGGGLPTHSRHEKKPCSSLFTSSPPRSCAQGRRPKRRHLLPTRPQGYADVGVFGPRRGLRPHPKSRPHGARKGRALYGLPRRTQPVCSGVAAPDW